MFRGGSRATVSACPVAGRIKPSLGELNPHWLLGFSACPVASRLLGFSACLVMVKMQHSVQRGFSASRRWLLGFSASRLLGFSAPRLARRLLGFSACPVASRLLGFSACWLLGLCRASRLLGFSASRLLGFSACVVLRGFSASRLSRLLGFSASRLLGFWSHFWAPFARALSFRSQTSDSMDR